MLIFLLIWTKILGQQSFREARATLLVFYPFQPTQVVLVSECPRLSHVDTKFVAHNADRGITVSGSNFPDEAVSHIKIIPIFFANF